MMLNLLSAIPFWVFILFFFLIAVSIRALNPHSTTLFASLIIPMIFLSITYCTMITTLDGLTLALVFSSILLGIVCGKIYWHDVYETTHYCLKKKIFLLAGSCRYLILLMTIFIIKFILYWLKVSPTYSLKYEAQLICELFTPTINGIISGIFVVRSYYLFRIKMSRNQSL